MGGGIRGMMKAALNPTAAIAKKTTKKAVDVVTGAIIPDIPEIPKPEDLPEAPREGDAEVQAAKKKERKASRLRQGRQSTILSNLRQQLFAGRGGGGAKLG